MARSSNTDYGRHLTELRRRARRPNLKSRKGRSGERRAAIHRSKQES